MSPGMYAERYQFLPYVPPTTGERSDIGRLRITLRRLYRLTPVYSARLHLQHHITSLVGAIDLSAACLINLALIGVVPKKLPLKPPA
jgi:hypothetical protein